MKHIAIAAAFALGSSVAMAQSAGMSGSGGAGVGNAGAVGDPDVGAYWDKTSKDGYMTRDQATGYRSKDGKTMDMAKADKDGDGRVSRSEWTNYHGANAVGGGARRQGGDGASSGSGAPAGATGSSSTGTTR